MSLEGRTVVLAEGRQLEELAGLLEKEGARPLRYPMLNILDAPDPAPVHAWLDDLAQDSFELVVLMTGEAVRRLIGFAERAGKREEVVAALARTRTLSRGPKPVKAMREIGLSASLVAAAPTTAGVIDSLQKESIQGKTIGYTLYAAPNETLDAFLRQAGAEPRPVLSYIYAPASDADRIVELIQKLDEGSVDVIVFTSSPQLDRLFAVAREKKLEQELRRGLERTRVAAVGPVVAETLEALRVRMDVCPASSFVMTNLVRQIRQAFQE